MMWGNFGPMGWGWVFGGLVDIGVVIIVFAIVRMASGPRSRPTGSSPASPLQLPASARQILDERYAKGELTTEEYQERLHPSGGTACACGLSDDRSLRYLSFPARVLHHSGDGVAYEARRTSETQGDGEVRSGRGSAYLISQ